MPSDIDITDPIQLRSASIAMTASQLEVLRAWVQELIDERAQLKQQKVDERNQKQMRGLMAKAGISWEEFQAALK